METEELGNQVVEEDRGDERFCQGGRSIEMERWTRKKKEEEEEEGKTKFGFEGTGQRAQGEMLLGY